MIIPPLYVLTSTISQYLAMIQGACDIIDSVSIPTEVETNIRRASLLKSSLFSARIEGNTLTLDELANTPSKDQKKVEVFNIAKALDLVTQRRAKDIAVKDILQLHAIIMNGLTEKERLGKFRKESSAVFNSAGIAIYMPPSARSIPTLIEKLLKFMNSSKEPLVPIRACLAHYSFEKIHPFLDGNGRVGRLLLQAVLYKGGYGMKGLVSVEEFLDTHRTLYYRGFDNPQRDVTDYVEWMLQALYESAQKAKQMVLDKKTIQPEDYLLPRRAEIYNIIKDHRLVNFDQIRRRFRMVNERTLRYDLKKLQDERLIRKLGTTNGAHYEPFKET